MVLHLTVSNNNGDDKPRTKVNGKTTKQSKVVDNVPVKDAALHFDAPLLKLPSYRKSEHAADVASLAEHEAAMFKHDDEVPSENEVEEQEPEDNQDPSKDAPYIGAGSSDINWVDSEEKKKLNLPNTYSEDISENILLLKASVDTVLQRLKRAAQENIQMEMDEMQPEIYSQKSAISERMEKVAAVLFEDKDEIREKTESVVLELVSLTLQDQFEEQALLWVADLSTEMDEIVAIWEDQGLDVNEIDGKLTDFEENQKLPELMDEIQTIGSDIRQQIPHAVPSVLKSTLDGILENLGQHTELVFDADDNLNFDIPLPVGVKFTEEDLLGALADARTTKDSDEGEEIDDGFRDITKAPKIEIAEYQFNDKSKEATTENANESSGEEGKNDNEDAGKVLDGDYLPMSKNSTVPVAKQPNGSHLAPAMTIVPQHNTSIAAEEDSKTEADETQEDAGQVIRSSNSSKKSAVKFKEHKSPQSESFNSTADYSTKSIERANLETVSQAGNATRPQLPGSNSLSDTRSAHVVTTKDGSSKEKEIIEEESEAVDEFTTKGSLHLDVSDKLGT